MRLKSIDPRLVADHDNALSQAVQVCADIRAGADDGTAAADAVSSYKSGGGLRIDTAEAKKIVALVKQTYCH